MALPEGFVIEKRKPVEDSIGLPEGFVQVNIPEIERGFASKIAESFNRGQEGVLADVAFYEAAIRGKGDVTGAFITRKKTQQKQVLDPIESNFLTNLVYSGSRMLGQWYESSKRGGVGAAVVGGIGAGIGALVGLVIPTVGEEPVTVATGAITGLKVGAKLGFTEGVVNFWYRQGAGMMLAEMIEQGVDPNIATRIAQIAAIPYALIEMYQMKTAAKPLTDSLRRKALGVLQKRTAKILGKAVKTYGKTLSHEILQEIEQEIIQIGAEDLGKYFSGQGIEIDENYLKERGQRLWEVTKGAAESFALLPIPGTAVGTTMDVANVRAYNKAQQAVREESNRALMDYQREMNLPSEIETAEGVLGFEREIEEKLNTDPLYQLQTAINESIVNWDELSKIRKQELAGKFSEAEEVLKSSTGDKAFITARAAYKGALSNIGIEALETKIPVESWNSLIEEIRVSDRLNISEKESLYFALRDLMKDGKILRPYEIKLARKQFGSEFAQSLEELAEKAKPKTKTDLIYDLINLPKATSASIDISRTGRQNILAVGTPKLWWQALVKDWHLFLSGKENALVLEKSIQTNEFAPLRRRTVLKWNKFGEGKVGYFSGTEQYASNIAGKIPGVERSEIAFSMGGNFLRASLFDFYAKMWEGTGKTFKDYNDLAHVINIITGEGDARWLGKHAYTLNAIFFAPRLLAARIQAFTMLANPNLNWEARKILAYHVTSFVAANMAILSALSAVPGVDVERDPRSSDFGKIRIGDTRIDFWGGYIPIARLITHLITGERKTRAGRIIEQEWADAVSRFFQAKLSPVGGFVLDVMRGETFYGDDVTLDSASMMEQAYHRFTPFFIQDVVDALKYQGIGTALSIAPLAFHGVGVQTYPMTAGTQLALERDEIARNVFGTKWDNLGPKAQGALTEGFPELTTIARTQAYERGSPKFVAKIINEQTKAGQRIYKSLPSDIRLELDNLLIKIPGVSRKIGSNWYLNDTRYKQYQKNYGKILNKILPNLIRSPKWEMIPEQIKILILEEIMNKAKKAVRESIVTKASIEDIIRVRDL